MSQKPSVLGKGLASLLPGAAAGIPNRPPQLNPGAPAGATAAGPQVPANSTNRSNVEVSTYAAPAIAAESGGRQLGISLAITDEIQVNPYQPRREFDEKAIEELAASIVINGIIQPLVVRKTATGYQLIAGERRLRAAKKAGLKQVPVVIRKSTDKESLEIALIENIQRQDLNCIDEALGYQQLIEEFNLTQEEAAKRVGKERATVANHVRLLRLHEAVIDDLKRGILTFGHGKALAGLDDKDQQLLARAQIVGKKLSVRDTEVLIEGIKRGSAMTTQPATASATSATPVQSRLASVAQNLTRQYSARVEIKGSEKRGKIVLHYATRQELERILAAMQNDSQAWPAR